MGEQSVYRLSYSSRAISDLRGIAGSEEGKLEAIPGLVHAVNVRIAGQMTLTAADRVGGAWLVKFRMDPAEVEVELMGAHSPEASSDLRKHLSNGIAARYEPDGTIQALSLPRGLDPLAAGVWKAVLGLSQVALPRSRKAGETSWKVKEPDANGVAEAAYRMISSRELRKSRTSAQPEEPALPGEEANAPVSRLEGGFAIRLGSNGWIETLAGAERQEVSLGGRMVGASQTKLELGRIERKTLSEGELSRAVAKLREALQQAETGTLASVGAPRHDVQIWARRRLAGKTFEEALESAQGAGDSGAAAAMEAMLDLRAAVLLHPSRSEEVARLLKDEPPDATAFRLAAAALAEAGHGRAQSALEGVVRLRLDEPRAAAPLVAQLGTIEHPNAQTVRALQAWALDASRDAVAETAILALGQSARNLLRKAPERSDELVDWLAERVLSTGDSSRKRLALLALGNCGSERARPWLERYASTEEEPLRAAAVFGLRFVRGESAERILLRSLSRDGEATVRHQAASALSFRPLDGATLPAQLERARREPETRVRIAILTSLARGLGEFEAVREVLLEAAKGETESVREAARELLDRG
jgi:HEAT repeat protein